MAERRFRLKFNNVQNKEYLILIFDSDFTGDEVELLCGGDGFTLEYQTNGDDYLTTPIVASTVKIPILVRDDTRDDIIKFLQDIATSDEDRFLVIIQEDDQIYWRGKIQSEQVQIPDKFYSEVTIFASDGFGRLASKTYSDGEGYYYDYAPFVDHFHNIISKLGLYYEVLVTPELAFVMNWTHADLDGIFFENISINHEALKSYTNGESGPYDCLTILRNLLIRFNCRIIQQDGIFFIQQYGYMCGVGNKNVTYYDQGGNFIETTTGSFNTTSLVKLAGGMSFYREPAQKSVVQYGYSIGSASNMFGGNLIEQDVEKNCGFLPNLDDAAFAFAMDFIIRVTGTSGLTIPLRIRYLFTIRVTNITGSYYYKNRTGFGYLDPVIEPEWSIGGAYFTIMDYSQNYDPAQTADYIQSFGLICQSCPIEGTLYFTWSHEIVTGYPAVYTTESIKNVGTIVYGINDPTEGVKTTVASSGNATGEVVQPEVLLTGDKPFGASVGKIKYYDGAEWKSTNNDWGLGTTESFNIDQLLAREIMAMQKTAVKMYSAVIRSDVNVANKIDERFITRALYVANDNIWNIECYDAKADRNGISFSTYITTNSTNGLPGNISFPSPAPTQFWQRTGTTLSPTTTGDKVQVAVTGSDVALTLSSVGNTTLDVTGSTGPVVSINTNISSASTVFNLLRLTRNTTGSALAGIGSSIDFSIEQSGGTTSTSGLFISLLTNVSSVTSAFTWWLRNAGAALAEVMRLTGAGQLQMLEARIGDATNNATFSTTGHLTLNGSATYWDDLRVPVSAIKAAGVKDPGFDTWQGNLRAWFFDNSTEEELFFECQIPHSYKEGSDIYPHIHWIPKASAATATRVRWGLEYTWVNLGGTVSSSTTIYTTTIVPNENLVGYKHYMSAFAAITGTSKTISSMLSCRVFRDSTNAADDFSADAGLLEIDFHIECDTLGSQTETSKT